MIRDKPNSQGVPPAVRIPGVYNDDLGRWDDEPAGLDSRMDACLRPYDKSQALIGAQLSERAQTTRLRLWATIAVSIMLTVWGVWSLCLIIR